MARITLAETTPLPPLQGVCCAGFGDLASPTDYRTTRQNDGHRHPSSSAERHVRCARDLQALSASGSTRHAVNHCSGASIGRAAVICAQWIIQVTDVCTVTPADTESL